MIQANQNQTKGDFKKVLYTGIGKIKVAAINPSLEELKAIGVNFKTEPVYVGQDRCKVVVWTHNEQMGYVQNTFWINVPTPFSTGSWQFIDKYGKNQIRQRAEDLNPTYESNGQTFTSIDVASARKAYGGEINLTEFVKNWADVQKDRATGEAGQCRLDTMDKIVRGDVTELKSILGVCKDHEVFINFGVREGQYQDFYPKAFARGWSKEPTAILNAMKKETSLKSYFGEYPYSFQEYIGAGATVAATTSGDLPF